MLTKAKSVVSWMRARLFTISLADIQKYLMKIIILAPMVMLLIYLVTFGRPRYMSESKVATRRSDDLNGDSLDFGLFLGASNPSSMEDALYLKEYISSSDILVALGKQLSLREVLSHNGLDFLNHLSKDETAEGFSKYYRDRINASCDDETGLLNIQTQGSGPELALKFNQAVSKELGRFTNEMSHRIAHNQLVSVETEMEKIRQRLDASKARLLFYQDDNNVLDLQAQARAANTLVSTLMSQETQMETDPCNLLTYLCEDVPQVVSVRNATQPLQVQINEEQSKIITPQGDRLNRMAVDFEEIKLRVRLNTELYGLTLTSIEKTRIEVARKLEVLSAISSPQLPQESSFPNIPYLVTYWLLVCCLLFGALKLLLTVIEDHRG